MKRITIPRIYVFALIAIFALFPLLMTLVNGNDLKVEAIDLNAVEGSMILTERQEEVKEALSLCMQSEALFSLKTSAGDTVYKDESGYVFFEANDKETGANASGPMTISGEKAAKKVFKELLAYGIVKGDGYIANVYPVIESTYNGEKDVFENDKVVYYEITITKEDSTGKTIETILSIYNNGGLSSFGYYSK